MPFSIFEKRFYPGWRVTIYDPLVESEAPIACVSVVAALDEVLHGVQGIGTISFRFPLNLPLSWVERFGCPLLAAGRAFR